MPWLYRDVDQHKCQLPSLGVAQHGDVWQCDACQQVFEVKDDQRDGKYFAPVKDEHLNRVMARVGAGRREASRIASLKAQQQPAVEPERDVRIPVPKPVRRGPESS